MIDNLDEDVIKVLELSQEILELIEQNIVNFSSVEADTITTTNESIQFFLEQENVERALKPKKCFNQHQQRKSRTI